MISIIDIIRLVRKHIVLLVVFPLLLAGMVAFITRKPTFSYASQTTLYTGLATGLSVEMNKTFNFAATNTAFDNLINIIKSRETQNEVAIRLLSRHLMMTDYNPKYISLKSFNKLKEITPLYIHSLVANRNIGDGSLSDSSAYELTVKNLTGLMHSSDTNFVYKLLNYTHPHYSVSAISSIRVQRIFSSDLLKMDYQADDPGICQQTLEIMNEVCIRNFKHIKENRSDAIVKYFETELSMAAAKLKKAEDKLLAFNMENNIINYYEQSKAVAMVKEEMGSEYKNKIVEIAGLEASIKRIEEKLTAQQQIQIKSADVLEKKNRLGEISYQIAAAESRLSSDEADIRKLVDLKLTAENLKEEIKKDVNQLFIYGNTIEGLPVKDILTEWLNKTIDFEDAKASLQVMSENYNEFLRQYEIYAPAGANLKRIEREISVSESEYLEILHGLNLANLRLQDNEFSSNIKAVDPPYYPLNPIPTKRKLLVLAAALAGLAIVLSAIFAMEYFDETLKNPLKAAHTLKIPFLGVIPKFLLNVGTVNFTFIVNRLLELTIQNADLYLKSTGKRNNTCTFIIFSTMNNEGKTTIAGNLAGKLLRQGRSILMLSYSHESLEKFEVIQMNSPKAELPVSLAGKIRRIRQFPFLSRLLGYPDPRVDYGSLFLSDSESYLGNDHYFTYKVDDKFYNVKDYKEILEQNNITLQYIPDYVLIEIPPVLYYPYPASLISAADIPLLVVRSNRNWSVADQSVLDALEKVAQNKIHFILNGVELLAVESVMGELPKERSILRRKMKNFFRFQFFSESQI